MNKEVIVTQKRQVRRSAIITICALYLLAMSYCLIVTLLTGRLP